MKGVPAIRAMAPALLLWLAVVLLTVWAYQPGLSGPLLLDDYENLRVLKQLDENPEYAGDVIWGNNSGPLGRPVAMASFVYERLYFDGGIAGQKRFNLALHLINSLLVLLLAQQLLSAAGLARSWMPAAIASCLWLSSPLLLSTTLYVVQRMTLLASLFMFTSMLCFLRGRIRAGNERVALAWYLAALLSAAVAAYAKETGLLVIPMVVAIELLVFSRRYGSDEHKRLLLLGLAGAGLVLLLAVFSSGWWLDWLTTQYARRDYSLGERVLTQFRVLWDYVAQLLAPEPARMGLYQDDIQVSRGLVSPRVTLAALLGWLLIIASVVAGFVLRRWTLPLLGAALFLIGHAMESTVLPLELYFEHRNYLPSFGLWFGLAAAGLVACNRLPALRGWAVMLAGVLLIRNVMLLASQAVVWSNPYLIHIDAVNHHPGSLRAHLQLAQLYARDGNLEAALATTGKAWPHHQVADFQVAVSDAVFYCQAGVPIPEGMFAELVIAPGDLSGNDVAALTSRLVRLMIDGNCPATDAGWLADQLTVAVLAEDAPVAAPRIVGALMLLDNHAENYERALARAIELSEREPEDVMALQFTLYLSERLNLPETRQKALSALTELRDSGRLNRQETYNVELFLGSQG